MRQAASKVLKSNLVRAAEPFRIGAGRAMGATGQGAKSAQPSSGGQAVARLVSQAEDHAIVEVTCPCGSVVQLKCNYASASQPAPEKQ